MQPLPIQVQVASEVVEVAVGPFALDPSRQLHEHLPGLHVGCVAQALQGNDEPTEITSEPAQPSVNHRDIMSQLPCDHRYVKEPLKTVLD